MQENKTTKGGDRTLRKVGIGGVYKSADGRGIAVAHMRETGFGKQTHYHVWIARLDGNKIGEGSLSHCRKLLKEAR